MNPFDPRDFVYVGIDPKERTVVALRDGSDPCFAPPSARFQHGDFGYEVHNAIRHLDRTHETARLVFSMPMMPGANRWVRLHPYGPEWLEAVTAIRCFVGNTGGTGHGLIRFYRQMRINNAYTEHDEDKLLSSSLTAYRLACAARWETLKPDDIQNP